MSLDIVFKVWDAEGKETFFETHADELTEQKMVSIGGETYYLWELLTVSFDKENLFSIQPKTEWLDQLSERVSWEIAYYWVDLGEVVSEPKQISRTEFLELMRQNQSAFDNEDNKVAQTTAYFAQEV